MHFIEPINRAQVTFGSLEDLLTPDNPVRLIDAFADRLDLKRLGFGVKELKREGRPAFESGVFLKLYFYGYRFAATSSWRLLALLFKYITELSSITNLPESTEPPIDGRCCYGACS